MFMADLFTITPNQKQPRHASGGKRISRYTYTMKFYSVLKRNVLSSHEKTQFKCVFLSERNQAEKALGFQIHDILKKAKLYWS